MRKKTFSRFLQGAVSMVMVASMLTGCGGSAASTSSSNASAETATTAADNVEYKDTLVVGEYGDSDSLIRRRTFPMIRLSVSYTRACWRSIPIPASSRAAWLRAGSTAMTI